MKKKMHYLAMGFFLLAATSLNAQFVTKSGEKSNNTNIAVTGTEEADISAFQMQKQKLEKAYMAKDQAGVTAARQAIEELAQKEINRSSNTLNDLKSGKLTVDPNSGKAFNVKLEIQVLTNRLNREKYLFNQMKTFEAGSMTNPRDFASIRSNLVEFEKLMKSNLKYEKKSAPSKKGGTNAVSPTLKGGGTMISSHNNQPQKSASSQLKHNSDFYKQNEQRQVDALKRASQKRKEKAKELLSLFDTYVKKGNFDRASGTILESSALVHSDIRAIEKFLERANSFKNLKINKEALTNLLSKEKAIEKGLKSINVKNMQDLKENAETFKNTLNQFISLKSIL